MFLMALWLLKGRIFKKSEKKNYPPLVVKCEEKNVIVFSFRSIIEGLSLKIFFPFVGTHRPFSELNWNGMLFSWLKNKSVEI